MPVKKSELLFIILLYSYDTASGWYIDDIEIIKKAPVFTGTEDFEPGWGDWSTDNGVWQVGTPTAGPEYCHSGVNCAGTNLDGNYPNNTDSRLISPSIQLPAVSGDEEIHLRFWHWFSYRDDQGYIQVSTYDESTGEWSSWETIGGTVNSSSDWALSARELTNYAGQKVRIAFYHTADSYDTASGWYIDDVIITPPPSLPSNRRQPRSR